MKSLSLLLFLFSFQLAAQTDSVRYDKWVGWVSPTTLFHLYHPAVEIGAEYDAGKRWAYIVNYGWDVALKGNIPYHGQRHQYVRVGLKKYKRKNKLTTGYLMTDVGFFHLSHYGNDVTWRPPLEDDPFIYARFHEFLLKPRVLIGAKLAGDLRMDVFTGLGFRVGMRRHSVIDPSEYPDGPRSSFHGMFSPAESITLDSPRGWSSVKALPVFSLGLRIGIGFKPVTVPAESFRF